MEEKILTLHPQGKRGVNIIRTKYETMKRTILEVLGKGNLTHDGLTAAVETKLKGQVRRVDSLVHGRYEARLGGSWGDRARARPEARRVSREALGAGRKEGRAGWSTRRCSGRAGARSVSRTRSRPRVRSASCPR